MEDSRKAELGQLILDGRKIDAIKVYREETGLGLKESKEAVEKLEQEMRAEFPEKFPARSSGCSTIILIGFVGLLVGLMQLL